MTTPGNLICAKCGFSNVPGDQFCGSCGTFLEWDGVPTDPTVPTDVPVIADPVPGPPPVTPPLPGPLPGPPPGASAAPIAGLVRCPSCGIANPADRTFCQSCGTKLPEGAARVTSASPEDIAIAVNGPATGPVVPTRPTHDTPGEDEGSGSRTRVLIALCVLGVLLGVGAIAGYSLMRGGAESGATQEPTGGPTTGPTAGPSGGSDAPPTSSATAGPTASPPEPEPTAIALRDVTASSSAPGFPVKNVHDGKDDTAWKEGVAQQLPGVGESITLRFARTTVTGVEISNGFNQDFNETYVTNGRVKGIAVSVNGKKAVRFTLEDTPEPQLFAFDAPIAGATRMQITILSVYPGRGPSRNSTALNEIVVMGVTE